MKKKVNYDKWTTAQLEKQIKQIRLATGLLAGMLIVLFAVTIYKSVTEMSFHPLLVTPIALSVIIPVNYKRMKEIKGEIERRK